MQLLLLGRGCRKDLRSLEAHFGFCLAFFWLFKQDKVISAVSLSPPRLLVPLDVISVTDPLLRFARWTSLRRM